MFRIAWLLVAATALVSSALADAQTFSFTSDNPSGTGQHSGTVAVSETGDANIYDVVWTIPEGSLKGLAFVDEASDMAYVSYQQEGVPGLVVLQQGKGREWIGTWHQGGRTGREVWSPVP